MEVVLKIISAREILSGSGSKIVLYGDFNVLNHLYTSDLKTGNKLTIYPDSTAVYFILKYLKKRKLRKIISTDLQEEILEEASEKDRKMFFLGDSDEVLTKMIERLKQRKICKCITGFCSGYNIDSMNVVKQLRKLKPDILFVGLGAGRQEKWIIDHCQNLEIPLIISTGGWFKLLAGVNKRAPLWMRKIHLEWLFKLCSEYSRVWKRYFIGVPLFLYRILSKKIILKVEN